MDITIPYYEDNTRISRSFLNWFRQSPKYAKDMLDGKEVGLSGKQIDKGIMVHAYLLEPEEFKKTYRVLTIETPTSAQQKQFCKDYISSKANKPILKALEAFKKNYSTNGKSDEESARKGLEMALKLKSYIKWLRDESISQKAMTWGDISMLKTMKENILLHKKAKELLFNNTSDNCDYLNEFHINWEFRISEDEIIKCKSLLDRIIIDYDNKKISLIDIKTTGDLSKFSKSFKEYDYGMQSAFYWMAIYWYMKNEKGISLDDWEHETYIVAIKNNGDYGCKVFNVEDNLILLKTYEIEQILKEINWHITNNLWEYSREYYEGDGVESLNYD